MALFRNTRRLFILLVSLLVVYALVGFVVIPWVAKSKLPVMLSEQLGRPSSVTDIEFNPFTLSLTVHELAVHEDDQSPIFGFQEFFINFQFFSLFQDAYTFEEVSLVLPYGLVKIRPDGTLNVAELGPTTSSESESEEVPDESSQESGEEAGLPPIEIHHLAIEQGMVEFHDESRATPFSTDIVPIDITLNNFTTRGDAENPYAVTAEFGDGETLHWEGTLVVDPLSSSGKISLTGLHLHTPWQYLQDQLRFEIQKGLLSVSSEYQVTSRDEAVEVVLSAGEVHVTNLELAAKGNTESVLAIPSFDIEGVSVDLTQQEVTIPFVRSKDANLAIWLTNTGVVNYQELFAPVDARESDAGPKAKPDPAEEPSGKPWVVDVQDFILQNYAVQFEDRTLATPAQLTLEGVDLQVTGLNTTLKEPFDVMLVMSLNEEGKVDIKGSVGVEPMIVDLDLMLSNLALAPFFPYVSPYVQFELNDGALDLGGTMRYQGAPTNSPVLHYEGSVALNKFVANDPELTEEFLKIQSFSLKELVLDVEPTTVSIGEIELAEPFVKATLAADGAMNFSRLFSPPGTIQTQESPKEEPSQSDSAEPAQDPLPVNIKQVRLVNATAQFADLSLEPNVLTGIQELTGTIAGLSSAQIAKADVDLKGKVDKYAPFEVKGKINPLSKDAYSDLVLLFNNVDLTAVSPYSGKYAGHPITKGKLSLDLKYKVAEHILEGENKILIDQMTMGEETGSPDATSLPVPLAIALLKDRHGKIDIDLPVRGNLDDPDFSYGGVLIQTLINLLTKAVTSPFNLVGGLIGGGSDDLQFVEFDLGSSVLSEKEQEKLNSLATALTERPALRLDVTGTADPTGDQTALAEVEFGRQLNALRAEETDMRLDEQPRLTRMLFVQKYGEEAAAKLEVSSDLVDQAESDSENVIGAQDGNAKATGEPEPAQEPWEQMKRQLLDAVGVDENDIRLLAQQRAKAIRDHLIQQGKIPTEQVFLIESQLNAHVEENLVRSPLSLTAGS